MAKKFQFRLEVVRKLREQARDAKRRSVADAVRTLTKAERQVAELTEQLRDTVELNRAERAAPQVDVSALRVGEFYRNWLHHRILEGTLTVARQQTRLSAERAKLGAASARLKAIEKLKERRWARHRQQVGREERAAADEAALQPFVAKLREVCS